MTQLSRNSKDKIQIVVDGMPAGTIITIESLNGTPRVSFDVEPGPTDQDPVEGAWEQDGVILPGGSKLRFDYRNTRFQGLVENGLLVFEGGDVAKKSPTGAAMAAIKNRFEDAPNLNGWSYISRYDEEEERWDTLADLRPT